MENFARMFKSAELKARKFEYDHINKLKKENPAKYGNMFGYHGGESTLITNEIILNHLIGGMEWLELDKSTNMVNRLRASLISGSHSGDKLDASYSGGKAKRNRQTNQQQIKRLLDDLITINNGKKYYFYAIRLSFKDVYIAKDGKNNHISKYYMPMDSKGNNVCDTASKAKTAIKNKFRSQSKNKNASITGNPFNEFGLMFNTEFGFEFEQVETLTVPKINLHLHGLIMLDSPIDFSAFNQELHSLMAEKTEDMDMFIEPVYTDYHKGKHKPLIYDTSKDNNKFKPLFNLIGYNNKQFGFPNLARTMKDGDGQETGYTQGDYLKKMPVRAVDLAVIAMANGMKGKQSISKYGLFNKSELSKKHNKARQIELTKEVINNRKDNKPLISLDLTEDNPLLNNEGVLNFNLSRWKPPP